MYCDCGREIHTKLCLIIDFGEKWYLLSPILNLITNSIVENLQDQVPEAEYIIPKSIHPQVKDLFTDAVIQVPESILILSGSNARQFSQKIEIPTKEVFASKLQNALSIPGVKNALTVELKPKCGLMERETLPSRYQMLQHVKLNTGLIERISEYFLVSLITLLSEFKIQNSNS